MLAGVDTPFVLALTDIGRQLQDLLYIALIEQPPGFTGDAPRLQAHNPQSDAFNCAPIIERSHPACEYICLANLSHA